MAERPDLRVTILTENSPDISQLMLARAADFCISMVPTQAPGVDCRPFVDMTMLCALPENHRLARADSVNLSDLDGEQMVMLGREVQSYRMIIDALSHAGARIDRSRWRIPPVCW